MTDDLETARRVKNDLARRLGDDSRLGGIGLAPQRGAPGCFTVVVRVTEASYVRELDLPAAVDGVPVQVSVVGAVVASGAGQGLTASVPTEDRPPVAP